MEKGDIVVAAGMVGFLMFGAWLQLLNGMVALRFNAALLHLFACNCTNVLISLSVSCHDVCFILIFERN